MGTVAKSKAADSENLSRGVVAMGEREIGFHFP